MTASGSEIARTWGFAGEAHRGAHREARRGARWALLSCALAVIAAACSPDYPKCDTDDECQAKEFCVNGMCQQCRGDQDCGPGRACTKGACQPIPGYCTSASDCGQGQECRNNLCVTAAQAVLPPPPPVLPEGCTIEPVYFEYDSSTLDSGAREQLSKNASCMKEKGTARMHLTGLTDPRGTEEYNLALGDRRAASAKSYLQSLGVQSEITYSSMGEEFATGTDEASWIRDRRVDFSER